MDIFRGIDLRSLVHINSEGKKELCLKGRKLRQVPDALIKLTEVEVLDLSDNELTELPEGAKNLNQLTTLVLSGNKLEKLPSNICLLKTLTTLDVAYNMIKTVPEAITNLNQLTKLNLSFNEIEVLPKAVFQLKKLTSLDVNSNPIKIIPKEITKLHQLSTLRVANTMITELPSILCQLKRLANLDLSRNEMVILPGTFSKLTQLQTLNLSASKLEELPESLFLLKGLTELDVSWNRLKKIPKNIEHLHQLTTLRLEGNNLFELPEAIGKLKKLTALDVSHNRLVSLPRAIECLTNLKTLLLSCNKLYILANGIFRLESLSTLDAGYNEIQKIPDRVAIANLTELTTLQLAGNELTEVPETVFYLRNLTTLDLSGNSLTTIPENIESLCQLCTLNLARNNLQDLPKGLFGLRRLSALSLSSNQLNRISDDIVNLDQLITLELSGNCLEVLPETIFKLTKLTALNLSSNQLKELPEDIINLARLTTLELSGNRLKELPEGIFQLRMLTTLTLSSNQLRSLNDDVKNLEYLTTLELSRNRLDELPEAVCHLKRLTALDISENQIKTLPSSLATLQNLTSFQLEQNPLKSPPVKVCQQGLTGIMTYLQEIRKGKACHQKVVLLGSSGAGKTSLAKTLAQNKPSCVDEEDRTIVLDRISWEIDTAETLLDVSMIDFGGDDIYKIVHHLFLDESSLVLLVVNLARYSDATYIRDMGSWINVLKTRVPKAQVILVGTHGDCLASEEELSSKVEMVKEHVSLQLKCEDFVVVSSKDFKGISDLRSRILKFVARNGKVLPSDWVDIYNALQNSEATGNQPFLTFDVVKQLVDSKNKGFYEILKSFFVSMEERTKAVLNFFHDTGILLWYQHTEELKKFVFHRAEFLTEVMKVFFSDKVAIGSLTFGGSVRHFMTSDSFEERKQDLLKRGIMSRTLLKGLWKDYHIQEDVFDAMIDLVIHLDLCYPMDNEGHQDGLRFPWFLTDDVPDVTYVKKMMHEAPCFGSYRLSLKYVYPAMCPMPLYHNFVVRLHRHIDDLKSRHDWRDGMYAQVKESKVLVHKSSKGTESILTLSVEGLDLLELWSILLACHEELKHLMTQWPGLRWECWIVCPHCTRLSSNEPGRFAMSNLEETKCPRGQVTCDHHDEMVPACLVYPVRRDDAKHRKALQEFNRQENKDAEGSNNQAAQKSLVFACGSPSTEGLNLLAREVCSTWKVLGRQLRLGDSELNQIEADNDSQYEQCYRMLTRWTEVQVNPPTYEELGKALDHSAVGRPDLAEKYCCQNSEEEYVMTQSPTLQAPLKEGKPNQGEILCLAQELKNWKQLGRVLKLKDSQLDEIDEGTKGLLEKSHAMLRRWMEANGSVATYQELARGLEIVARRDLIRNFCCETSR